MTNADRTVSEQALHSSAFKSFCTTFSPIDSDKRQMRRANNY